VLIEWGNNPMELLVNDKVGPSFEWLADDRSIINVMDLRDYAFRVGLPHCGRLKGIRPGGRQAQTVVVGRSSIGANMDEIQLFNIYVMALNRLHFQCCQMHLCLALCLVQYRVHIVFIISFT
jgi:hypothetical protein